MHDLKWTTAPWCNLSRISSAEPDLVIHFAAFTICLFLLLHHDTKLIPASTVNLWTHIYQPFPEAPSVGCKLFPADSVLSVQVDFFFWIAPCFCAFSHHTLTLQPRWTTWLRNETSLFSHFTAFNHWVSLFGEDETSVDNLAPSKNLWATRT